mgnify:CR=1 FL=1
MVFEIKVVVSSILSLFTNRLAQYQMDAPNRAEPIVCDDRAAVDIRNQNHESITSRSV